MTPIRAVARVLAVALAHITVRVPQSAAQRVGLLDEVFLVFQFV